MNKVLLFLLFAIYAVMAVAVPAKRERHTLTLADGTTIEATSMGDENLHFFLTDDGRCLQCDSDGIAHFVEADVLRKRWEARASKRQAIREKRNASRRRKAQDAMTGNKTGLVLLIQFPDVPFHYTNETFQQFFNKEGYTDDINIGSVRDYFLDASYGQFDFTFDVIGPVTLDYPLAHYGGNNSNGDDKLVATMVIEAIDKVDEEVDFSKYDWDGNGIVEHIFLIHSGHDEAQSNTKNDIWSHAWTLTEAVDEGDGSGPVWADGVWVDSYATSSELRNKSGNNIAGIGTACHEFTHCFGLPDFYDTAGYSFGMYSWDLMDYGSYNGDGGTPAGFTSYERMFCGWLDPIELTEPASIQRMPALTSEPVAYILRNSGKEDEYYLLENRQQDAWDKCLAGHGLLILHVDYDDKVWAENNVNTVRSHQRMTIIPADNSLYKFTLSGDPWPGTSGKTELSDTSTPSATLFNKNAEGDKLMHHSITQISESPIGQISFIFDELALETPSVSAATGEESVYDLYGRKMAIGKSLKGIYIIRSKDGKARLTTMKR